MTREFADDVLEYLWNESWAKLKSFLSNVGVSPSLLVSVSPRQIRAKLIEPRAEVDRRFEKLLPKWEEVLAQLDVLEPLLPQQVRSRPELNAALRVNPRHAVNEFRRCMQQNMSGYYFLPAVDPEDIGTGWVILLRSVQDLPPALARMVAAGLSDSEYQQLCGGEERFRGRLNLKGTTDGFAMPVGQVQSPFLEHLMQTFSAMFARIGTDDLPAQHIETVLSALMEEA